MDLALFDLDETLIDDDSASLWIRWLVGQGFAPAELELQEQQLMQLYYQGKLSMEDYMQATLAPLAGLSVQTVAGWVQRYIRRDILPRVYPAARERLQLAPRARRLHSGDLRHRRASGGADRRTARRR